MVKSDLLVIDRDFIKTLIDLILQENDDGSSGCAGIRLLDRESATIDQGECEQLVSIIFSNVVDRVEEIDIDIWSNSTTTTKDNGFEQEDFEAEEEEEEEEEEEDNDKEGEFGEFLTNPILSISILEECKKRVISTCWKDRHTALVISTRILLFLKKDTIAQKEMEIENLINMFIHIANDSNPRVRWAFFNFLSQICKVDRIISTKTSIVQLFISIIEMAIQDSNNRVKLACCQLIQIFLENNSLNSISFNHLFTLFEYLILSPQDSYCVESALDLLVKAFTISKEKNISCILLILEKYKSSSLVIEKCRRAFEAIRSFAETNGKQFSKQLKYLFQHVQSHGIIDYYLFSDYIEICSTVSKSLGMDYSIYLAPTMKFILDILNQDIETIDQEDENGSKKVDLVACALQNLETFVDSCKSSISPYLELLVDASTRLSTTNTRKGIRYSTTEIFRSLFNACIVKYGNNSQQAKTIYSRLLSCILDSCGSSEQEIGVLIEKLFVAGDDEQVQDNDGSLPESIGALFQLIGDIVEKNQGMVINVIKVDIIPETIQLLSDQTVDYHIKKSILQMFSDICQFGGQPSIVLLYPLIIPVMIGHLSSDNVEIALNAAVGLGEAAVSSKDQFAPYVFNVLIQLKDLISCNENRKKKNKVPATESAISAIGKLIRHVPQLAPHVGQIIPAWLERLPIKYHEENVQCIENLYHIIQLYPNECLGGRDGNQMTNVSRINHIVSKYTTDPEFQKKVKQMYINYKFNYDELVTYNRGKQLCNNIQSLLSKI
ncbi:hypothetical protein DFA_12178 [Cavenderia fasciculata]|uniref:Uncharacterized protein n=1 Tax=Cavenderia fasciculata TaxID=261658 RepID=F4QCH8_CACFS|nr:uncharacterized protein DFA_12178 [Cavenderia fasciculata]EGG14406.1 hypothetical protein DFA_12178 [Cavenderia fasciculata]|eukprot:XP_004353815.1 hypothetical protein DFA_12178 [Cavenderia fasciculata]